MIVSYLINRPVAVTAIFLSLLAIGIYGWIQIPVSLLPNVDPPQISIEVRKSSFSSEVMERTVMSPIRQSVIGSYGLKDVSSEATTGFGRVNLAYEFGTNMDLALIEVNEKIDRILASLPTDVNRPIVKKKKPSDIPLVNIFLSSEVYSMQDLSQLVKFEIIKRFEQLNGVAQIETNGTVDKSIKLVPKSEKIISAGLDINEISRIIQDSNFLIGQIMVKDGNYEYLIQIENLIQDKSSLGSLIIKTKTGQQIPLSELFEINEANLNPLNEQYFNGKQGIALAIYNQPEADLFSLEKELLSTLKLLRKEFAFIKFASSQNQVSLLKDNINQLYSTAGLAILFAFVVFLISSKSQRLPLILGTVIPSSILISIGTLWALGLTLNIITLSGFILGIGLLVDNVIILIEEINQKRAEGLSIKDACIVSAKNIFPALLSSTLTTVCVFIPLLAIDGIASELFKEQALALGIILLVSLALTFILIPTFYTRWISTVVKDRNWIGKIKKISHQRSRVGALATILILLSGGIFAINNLKTEDLPSYKTTDFQLRIIWNEPLSIKESSRRIQNTIKNFSYEILSAGIGISSITQNEINFFDEVNLYIKLSSSSLRVETEKSLKKRIASAFPKATVRLGKSPNPFEMIFYNDSPPVEARIRKTNGVFFSRQELDELISSKSNGTVNINFNETYKIELRKDRIENSPLTYPLLLSHLNNLTDEHIITTLSHADQNIPIAISGDAPYYFILLDSLYYNLSTFYQMKDTTEIRTITADLSGPYISFSGEKLTDVITYANEVTTNRDWIYGLAGHQLKSHESLQKLIIAGLLGLVLLYLILVAQFESFKQPLVIFSLIPLALMGSSIALYAGGGSINIMSIIGTVAMIGIIVNDSILKIDAINRNIKSGLPLKEAIKKAKNERFKPILMTSLSTVLALTPILLSSGIASDLQKPLAIVTISGLIVGTWGSISLLPSIYSRIVTQEL